MKFFLQKIADLTGVGIYQVEGMDIHCYDQDRQLNPLMQNEKLRTMLIEKSLSQDVPFIYTDILSVYFASIKYERGCILIGPMSLRLLDRMEFHKYYMSYGIKIETEKRLKHFSLLKMLNIIELIAHLISNISYTDNDLIYANHLVDNQCQEVEKEKIIFEIKENEEEIYHHTYQEERKLLDCVREGRVVEAVNLSKNMDVDLGKLSIKEETHWKNVSIVAITLCTRAAIEGGVAASVAYRLSDFYIQKCDQCKGVAELISWRNKAVEDITKRVAKKKETRNYSNYIERCKAYVEKNYRKKIYLDEMAELLGITPTYLSKLFHQETGVRLQEYIVQVRLKHAANLLMYSTESAAKIAEYVNFPSQSYLGKAFKNKYHMTPKQYRDLYKPSEF